MSSLPSDKQKNKELSQNGTAPAANPVVKIGPLLYTIKTVNDLKAENGQGLFGQIDYAKQIIELEEVMTPERRRSVLWHEVLHGIDELYAFDLKEHGVSVLTMAIIQLLNDNPDLR